MPTSHFITYKKQTGQLTSVISSYHPDLVLSQPIDDTINELSQRGEAFLPISEQHIKDYANIDLYYYSFINKKLVRKPPRLAPYLTFNYQTHTWEDLRTPEEVWEAIRIERNKLLQATDWTQLPDVPEEIKSKYAVYRQALRDITNQENPYNIKFPPCPS